MATLLSWEVLDLVCRVHRCGMTRWQEGLFPGGTIRQSAGGSLQDNAGLCKTMPVSGVFSCSLTHGGRKDKGVRSCGVTCTYVDSTAEKMFILVSDSVPITGPWPPPPHGSPCPGLALAFSAPHGDSTYCSRWKTNFFLSVPLFLRTAVPPSISPSCLSNASASTEPGAAWGEKRKARVRRSESVFWQR